MKQPESYICRLAEIIVKSYTGELTEDERKILDGWLDVGERNRTFYGRMKEEKWLEEKLGQFLLIDWKADCAVFMSRLPRKNTRNVLMRCLKYAAVIVLPLTVGTTVWMYSWRDVPEAVVAGNVAAPQENSSVLSLEDGKQIVLGDSVSVADWGISGAVLNVAGSELSYKKKDETEPGKISYNTLSVARGGEYYLILSDGTRVWLNSESRLRYPVRFSGNERRVYLEGEAFFTVKADSAHPFVVVAAGTETEVLGTEFNVRAYPEEETVSTTLVKGSVRMSCDGEKVLLEPGEQGQVQKESRNIGKSQVDVYLSTAWKDGRLVFRSTRMEDLMKVLTRWYNVDVFYQNPEAKDIRFTGDLCKTDHISELLNIIEHNGLVGLDLKGKTLMVKIK